MEVIGLIKTAVKQKYYKGLDEYLAMQYKSIFIVLILGWVSALMGCGKGSAVCDSGLKPKVNSNSPVGSNQSLKLSVYGISEGKTYTWTGPNGYESHETEPTISSPTRGKQVYAVTVVTNGNCTYSAISDSITVTGPTNTCGLDSNTAKLSGIVTMSFSKEVGTTGTSDYKVTGSSSSASVTVEFPNNQPPSEGTYTITSSSSALAAGYARVTIKAVTTSPWVTSSGTVYVSIDNNVTTISFCDVPFTSSSSSGTWNGGAHIVWAP